MDPRRPSEDEFLNEPLLAEGRSADSGDWPAATPSGFGPTGPASGPYGAVDPRSGVAPASRPSSDRRPATTGRRRESERLIGPGTGRAAPSSASGRVERTSGSGRVGLESGRGRSPGRERKRIGRYELHAELGRGAFATVYLAQIPGLERNFAIKLLTLGADQIDRARFEREAQIAARLDHPGIVPVLDFGVDAASGRSFLVMEHVPGQTLRDRLEREGSLPWSEAIAVVAEVADAMAAAHAAGVLHRDLKPDNILMDARGGRPRVCDFGLARAGGDLRGTLTQAGEAMGTPVYMAPEQARALEVTSRTDVYGLGMILYTLLVGEPPYVGKTIAETFEKVTAGGAPRPSRQIPGIPRGVDDLVLRSIHLDPAKRPESAAAFAAELRAAATARRSAGSPWLLSAALGLVALGLGVWAVSADGRASELALRVAQLEAQASATPEPEASPSSEPTPPSPPSSSSPSSSPPSSSPGTRSGDASLELELQELRRELQRCLDAAVKPSRAPRELMEAFERSLPESPQTFPIRVRLLANLGREREALDLLARAAEAPAPDPDLLAIRVELLLRFEGSRQVSPTLRGALRQLSSLAQPDTAPALYSEMLRQGVMSRERLEALEREAERFDKTYLWAFIAQIEGGQSAQAQDPEGLLRAAAHWRSYLRLDPGDATAHYKLSEAMYYANAISKDEALIPQIQAALRRSRDLVPRPVMWSFTGKSQVTLEHRPRSAVRELREARRLARAAGDEGEAHRAAGWLVVAHLLLGEDEAARTVAEGLRAAYPKQIYAQLRRALPKTLQPRLEALLREGPR